MAKFISNDLLKRTFYENHIFYQCEYDEKIYINLNGKAIELSSSNQFQTYLGFKKNMTFNIVEQVKMELLNDNANIVFIDNVIDEKIFTLTTNSDTSSFRKDIIKRCADKDEYIKAFNTLVNKNDELKEINNLLTELSDKLLNNYILIKNHTSTYSKYFKELGQDFRHVKLK
jgi:predicted lactoylglutathione lyase